jgi:AcrR family transcriptional regulator
MDDRVKGDVTISETLLARQLAELADEAARPDALRAFRTARRWFLAGRRFEMRELAVELGVNRVTLFRWVGSRDELLAEILWSLADPTLAAVRADAVGSGGQRVAAILGSFAERLVDAEYFRDFLRREPERALRILTTGTSPVQSRVVSAVEEILAEEVGGGRLTPPLPLADLSYVTVRIVESFVYADVITGGRPDASKVEQAVAALLR